MRCAALLVPCVLLVCSTAGATKKGYKFKSNLSTVRFELGVPGTTKTFVRGSRATLRMLKNAAANGSLKRSDAKQIDAAIIKLLRGNKKVDAITETDHTGQTLLLDRGMIKLTRHMGKEPGKAREDAGVLEISMKKPGQPRSSEFVSVIFSHRPFGGSTSVANIQFK